MRLILESNEKRKEEVKDEDVWSGVDKIRKRVKALEKELVEGAQSYRLAYPYGFGQISEVFITCDYFCF